MNSSPTSFNKYSNINKIVQNQDEIEGNLKKKIKVNLLPSNRNKKLY